MAMADIHYGNAFHQDPGDAIPDGSTILSGNFSQLVPDTPIMVGKPLTIVGGNWVNVRQDAAWTIQGGNWNQISRCYHLHPKWNLAVEPANCPHVTETHTITIDGQVVHTEYEREDTPV
jgi:hypothetical protein